MLLGLSLVVAWVGQAFALSGAKGWPLGNLLLGKWGPGSVNLNTPPSGQPVIPGMKTPPATRLAPRLPQGQQPIPPGGGAS